MFISREGLVSGSVNRAELVTAYNRSTDDDVKANLAVIGIENGMYVENGKLVDPSAPEPTPEPKAEPEEVAESEDEPPPRSGAGSGRDAWAAYAESQGVEVTDDMTRDDIIAAWEES